MQVDVIKYKIAIAGGYLAEVSKEIQELYLANPQGKTSCRSYLYQYYKPKVFDGNDEDWKALCADEDKRETLEVDFPRWGDFEIEVYEQDLSKYAVMLGKLQITETTTIPVHFTGSMEQKQLEAVQRLTDLTIDKLQRAGELIELHSNKLGGYVMGSEESFNFKCGQMQPGIALSAFNETCLLEDSCTDQLQDYLNDGWRIIAVSPQPDSRRPDYILGRYNVNYDRNNLPNGAQRGSR